VFTGLIAEMGRVASVGKKEGGATLSLKAAAVGKEASLGDSISVNGVCLTVTGISGGILSFDLSHETLKSTNLGALSPEDRVNIEPSLRADGKLGGHFVTGHVDAAGRIKSKKKVGDNISIEIEAPSSVTDYLVPKGSAAVDGISLTVVDVMPWGFSVVIIPHTADVTTIGHKGQGDTVNLEADIIGKYVARFLSRGKGDDSSLMSSLVKAGYIK
jgi:riboflavin synthase